jgi:23S rRNA (cytidine1920-2'-O)/16S rRNA (cytidine1409-2'-O)-methyltransferase
MPKVRLDALLADRGLFDSRTRAAASVLAGEVLIGDDRRRAGKPGQMVDDAITVSVDERPRFVSRGGVKLSNALDALGLEAAGRRALDVGASTGGFTDCLLQRGAEHVIALDVAYGELAWSLRQDPRVTVLERVNARAITPEELPYRADLVVADLSFISLTKVLPAVLACVAATFDALVMVKPQFEVGRERVGKGGVVRSAEDRRAALERVGRFAGERGWTLLGFASSGAAGDTSPWAPRAHDRLRRMHGPVSVRVLARGPLVATLEVRARLGCATGWVDVRLLLTLHAGSPALRCTLRLDNRATDHRLRLRVPTGVPATAALAGGPFGPVERAAVGVNGTVYARETPVATAPAQRYVAVADGARGLAVLAPGFFEYELAGGGDLRVTLLRSIGQLSRADLPTRPGHAGWPAPTPVAQCLGPDRLQLAVVPVTGGEVRAGTVVPELWEDVFLPPRAIWLRQATPISPADWDVRLEGPGLVFSAAKPAEDGDWLVLRCYNVLASPVEGAWRLGRRIARAMLTRADERGARELGLAGDGHLVPFHAGPRAIVTTLVQVAS